MTAQTEGIELPDDLNWHEPGVVRDIVLLHRHKFEQGRREGVAQGRREGVEEGKREGVELGRRLALLELAADVTSDAELTELRALAAIEDLAAAVKALLAR